MAKGKEPIAQQLNSIISTLDEIIRQTHDPMTYEDVAEEQRTIGAILTRTQLILGYIEFRRPSEYRNLIVRK